MINLLPDDYKKELRAARMNVVLLRYNFITLAAVAILALACGIFYLILSQNRQSAISSQSDNLAKAAAFDSTKAAADEYAANLATAKKILANQVNYTDVVLDIAALLPQGVVLDNINLTSKDFGNQTVLSAHAKNYDAVERLKTSLQNSKMFSNVYFQSITNETGEGKPYPINISISVKINKVEQ